MPDFRQTLLCISEAADTKHIGYQAVLVSGRKRRSNPPSATVVNATDPWGAGLLLQFNTRNSKCYELLR